MIISSINKQEIPLSEAVKAKDIREGIFKLIQQEYTNFSKENYISISELNQYRRMYLTSLILQERGEVDAIDNDVINAINNNSIFTENIQESIDEHLSLGQKVADKVADFGGSWTFILSFFLFILIWMFVNIIVFTTKPFDPYPFILLKLILSCLAAIQAPIIMMSQNRKEDKDRKRNEYDYKINLKAELEIKILNEKMDHLLINQNNKLLEIQEIQTDYLEDLMKEVRNGKANS